MSKLYDFHNDLIETNKIKKEHYLIRQYTTVGENYLFQV